MDKEVAARAVLGNRDVYLSRELFFRLLYPSLYKLAEEFYKKMSEHANTPSKINFTKSTLHHNPC